MCLGTDHKVNADYKVAIEGRVIQQAECRPVNDEHYRSLMRSVINSSFAHMLWLAEFDIFSVNGIDGVHVAERIIQLKIVYKELAELASYSSHC